MSTLVIAEHHAQQLNPSTLAAVDAAARLGKPIDLAILTHDQNIAKACEAIEGIRTLYVLVHPDFEHPLAEQQTEALLPLLESYHHVIAPSTTTGKNLLPRLAAKCGMSMLSDVVEIIDQNTFMRPSYAGNAMTQVQSSAQRIFLSIRPTAFSKAGASGNASLQIQTLAYEPKNIRVRFVSQAEPNTERPELSQAKIVVSGGRGLQSAEQFKILDGLADVLRAAIGASRAAVDAGFISNDHQVGQTGQTVAPQLYLAIGISGAIQHIAGMKESRVIVAINKDPDAPIFQISDYGMVGDLFEIVPELIQKLQARFR